MADTHFDVVAAGNAALSTEEKGSSHGTEMRPSLATCVGDGFQKHSYPFGIMVHADGKRFVDEGADFRNYTYAKYGREILVQPGRLLRDKYRIKQVTKVGTGSLEHLAEKLEGVNPEGFLDTAKNYSQTVQTDIPFQSKY